MTSQILLTKVKWVHEMNDKLFNLKHTETGQNIFLMDLKGIIQLNTPLHFIDFETLTCAIPHHKGMRLMKPLPSSGVVIR